MSHARMMGFGWGVICGASITTALLSGETLISLYFVGTAVLAAYGNYYYREVS